jgi:hypothetical protein
MRSTPIIVLGTTLVVSGCSLAGGSEPQPAAYTKPPARGWTLVTPPERVTVLELREALEQLPPDGAPLPTLSGQYDVDRPAVQAVYAKLQAADTADQRATILVEESLDRSAPVEAWTQVREFKTQERCESTKDELQEITRESVQDVSYYHGMPLYEMQWAFIEWGYRWASCVPVETFDRSPVARS